MTSYEITDAIIDSGDIDRIIDGIKTYGKEMIKGLIYKKKYTFAVAAIMNHGTLCVDSYIAKHLPAEHLCKVVDRLDMRYIIERGIWSAETVYNVYEAMILAGVDIIGKLITQADAIQHTKKARHIGLFVAIIYKKYMRPDDLLKYEKSFLVISDVITYLTYKCKENGFVPDKNDVLDLAITSIRLDRALCFRSLVYRLATIVTFDHKSIIQPLVSEICIRCNHDIFISMIDYVGIRSIRSTITQADLDNICKCGGRSILMMLGDKTIDQCTYTSSLVYHAAYNNHVTTVEYLLSLYPQYIGKAMESAVKGMAIDVMKALVKTDPMTCMSYLHHDLVDYVIKDM